MGQVERLTPVTPSNTPQSPTSGRQSPYDEDLQATVERINSLRLDSDDNTNYPLSSTSRTDTEGGSLRNSRNCSHSSLQNRNNN